MQNIFNYKLIDLENYFLSIGEKSFKARQIYDWLYVKRVNDFKLMTNIKFLKFLFGDFPDMAKIIPCFTDGKSVNIAYITQASATFHIFYAKCIAGIYKLHILFTINKTMHSPYTRIRSVFKILY